jgi:hypothetical protein
MAHHNNTPRSILDAPKRTVTPLIVHEGATRHERRHGLGLTMKLADQAIYMTTANGTHTSSKVRKVRHGRKARWNR